MVHWIASELWGGGYGVENQRGGSVLEVFVELFRMELPCEIRNYMLDKYRGGGLLWFNGCMKYEPIDSSHIIGFALVMDMGLVTKWAGDISVWRWTIDSLQA